jgi:hypothetical protein
MIETNIKKRIEWLKHNLPYAIFNRLLELGWSDEKLSALYAEIEEDSAHQGVFVFAKEACGTQDKNRDDDLIVFVDQRINGGMSGDEFAGSVFVQLTDNEYIEWYYSM